MSASLRLLIAGLLFGSSLAAQTPPPQRLHVQARLADSGGIALSGIVNLEVRIYDAASGGTALWVEPHVATAVNGVVSLDLGTSTAFPANLFDDGTRFLAFQVESDSEMTPRRRIGSVAYALRSASSVAADDVPGADITPASVSIGGSPVINAAGQWVGDPTGLVGPQGPAGADGADGAQGVQGPIGPQGIQGEQGPQGIQGDTGPEGPQGPQGIQGDPGPQGIQGLQGDAGPQGIQGEVGPQGIQGEVGPQGIQGEAGPVGPEGPVGPIGPVGPAGPLEAPEPTTVLGTVSIPSLGCTSGSAIEFFSLSHDIERVNGADPVSLVTFTKDFDDCSPAMLLGVNIGVAASQAVFTLGDFELTVLNPVIYEIGIEELEGSLPRERVSFVYDRAEWEWAGAGGPTSAQWSLGLEVGSSTAPLTSGTALEFALYDVGPDGSFPSASEITGVDHLIERTILNQGTTGIAQHQALQLTRMIDANTPAFMHAVGAGTVIDSVRVDVAQNEGGTEVSYLAYVLDNPLLTRVGISLTPDGDIAETVEIEYTRIEWTYRAGQAGSVTRFWNISTQSGG